MKKTITFLIFIFTMLLSLGVSAQHQKEVILQLIETSDIHGNYFPVSFLKNRSYGGGLSRVYTYVKQCRKKRGQNLILLDNGDLLQGQPSAYYGNYLDTLKANVAARALSFMGYDAQSMGNHDIETGHNIYDKYRKECDFPLLCANMISTSTGLPYFQPYQMFYREGVRVAVLGLITPAIPAWLPESLWSGTRFEDMVEAAKKWIPIIQKSESPDLIVGLFHAGQKGGIVCDQYVENQSRKVAEEVDGFDVVFFGHDHEEYCAPVLNKAGKEVWLIDPGKGGFKVGDVKATFVVDTLKRRVVKKSIKAKLTSTKRFLPEKSYMTAFADDILRIANFVNKPIGKLSKPLKADNALFGPNSLLDFVHCLQMKISGAEISISSPIQTYGKIPAGTIRIRNMFQVYRFENLLYLMELTGQEVKDELEYSYGLWFNQMKSKDDHLLLLEGNKIANYSFNFDSAAGIKYYVDVRKPVGERVHILSMADGSPFSLTRKYKVAVNSYRANGGGQLLTKGAGISKEELAKRVLWSSQRDMRHYMIEYISKKGEIKPKRLNNWWIVPKSWVKAAAKRDAKLIKANLY